MCTVYYPFFKIERETRNVKYDHKMNLLILALVSEKILIPSAHLLEMDNDKFDILLSYKRMCQEKIIYSRCSKSEKSLREYYEKKRNF